MNISGILLYAIPERVHDVCNALAAMPGIEIQAASDEGKVVVTLEDDSTNSASESYVALHRVPGVFSVALIYQYSDENLAPQERLQ